VKSYRYGILVVHGIGFQKRGETARRWTEALGRWFSCWLTARAERELGVTVAELGRGSGAAVHDSMVDDPANAEAPSRSVLSLRRMPSNRVDWLVAESWWSEAFQQPKVLELVSWIALSTPFLLVSHLGAPLVRTWRRLKRRPEAWRRPLLWLRLVVEGLLVPLAVPASLLVIALLLVLLVPTLIPIAQVRESTKAFATRVFGLLGDTFVVTMSPVRRDLVVGKVAADIAWMAATCDKFAIIAHSQGAALSHEALRRARPAELDSFFTLGSGIQKLLRLRLAFRDGRALVAYAWVAPALIAASAATLGAGLTRPSPNFWVTAVASFSLAVGLALLGGAVYRLRRTSGYEQRLHLPGAGAAFRWLDLYGSADPVPNGPAYPSPRTWIDEREVFLHASLFRDHTAYIHDDEGVLPVIAEQLSEGFDGLRFDDPDRDAVRDACWRRRLRTRVLSAARILITIAVIVAGVRIDTPRLGRTVAAWLPTRLRDSLDTVARPLPSALRGHHAGGICTWIIVGFGAYALFVAAFRAWASRERKMFFLRATRTNPLAGGQRVFFGGITLALLAVELALAGAIANSRSWRVPARIVIHHPYALLVGALALTALLGLAARNNHVVRAGSAVEQHLRQLFEREGGQQPPGAGESVPTS
jgi:hypothetical protein